MKKLLLSFLLLSLIKTQTAQNLQWAYPIGSNSPDVGYAIETDTSGNVFATGYFNASIDFDPGVGTDIHIPYGGSDIYLTKSNSDGIHQWAIGIGGASNDAGNDLVTDSLGNVYVIGSFEGTIYVDPNDVGQTLTAVGGKDIFLAKYNKDGLYQWAYGFGSASTDIGYSIDLDKDKNIIISGSLNSSVDFDPSVNTAWVTATSGYDGFVAKYDSNMNLLWAFTIGGNGVDEAEKVTVDASGNVYVAGYFATTVDFDPSVNTANLAAYGSYDGYVAKYDANGNYSMAIQFGGSTSDHALTVGVATNGDIIVGGYYSGTADFDPTASMSLLTSTGSNDGFVASYSSIGSLNYAFSLGGVNYNDAVYDMELDGDDNIYLSGSFSGIVDFDPGIGVNEIPAFGNLDIFYAKYDLTGNFVWAFAIGGSGEDNGYGINVESNGVIQGTGYFRGAVDFDPGSGTTSYIAQAGTVDGFMAKYTECSNTFFSEGISICDGDSYYVQNDYQTISGTYYDTLLGSNGCDSVHKVVLTVLPLPIIYAGLDQNICEGESVVLSATGGVNYYWDNGVIDGVTFTPTTTLTYSVIGEDANGCGNTDAVVVYVHTIPDVQMLPFNPDHICSNVAILDVPAAVPTGGIYWGNGVSGTNFDPQSSGTGSFWVYYTYTDGNNCSNADSTMITVEDCSGIEESSWSIINIFPNPTNHLLNITGNGETYTFEIYDAKGRLILVKTEVENTIDVSFLENGMYVIRIQNNSEKQEFRFVKN